ncbi:MULTISPECIES: sensor domain-containing diguanylate cyclase [unclassified Gilvimarinus]|uniref:sensor domain-containing diguanylate cyclase n=1 Tax=unclassified Gilvimarinus TaxID=2642066 RepID=UPI0026E41224|nr:MULTISPECIES: diguanylate cyclase [unclassified Gilvimarinus]MDO6572488.1 diguanylate cyclase [Gilvimarinus sp. 2_MG-2023]MDO6746628.1 diguanylate cyclase [Gilvimarinus sp. 1_MG-2023]
MHTRRFFALYALMTLLGLTLANQQAAAYNLEPTRTLKDLDTQILLAVEPLTIDQATTDLRWQEFQPRDNNQGISDKHYWVRFSLHNPEPEDRVEILSTETSYLDHMAVYLRRDSESNFQSHSLSDREPFSSRPVFYRTLALPIVLPAGTKTEIYIQAYHTKADSLTMGFKLESPSRFATRQQQEHLSFGLFYGALSIMALMASIFAITLKQRNAAYYALFLLSSIVFWLMLNGLGFQYLWPEAPWWHNEGFHLVYLIFVICALQFSKSFLQLQLLSPHLNVVFIAIQAVAGTGIIIRLIGFYEPILTLSYGLLAALALILPVASFAVWRKGLDYALWSLLAWLIYAAGLILSLISAATPLFNWGMTPLFYVQIAALLETLFLMIGLSKWLIQLESERQQAITQASEDPLTGLGNRRRLQIAFTQLKDRMAIDQRPAYVLMIDLDYFKQVNDNYGHEAGDQVLKDVGRLLLRTCRDSDVVTRYGGEEFAILLRASEIDSVIQIAERIRIEFESTPTQYNSSKIAHTLCCGIAEVMNIESQPSVQDMMRHADAALYQAKAAGRNQTYVYPHEHKLNHTQLTVY